MDKSISSKVKKIDLTIAAISIVTAIYAYKKMEYNSNENLLILVLVMIATIYLYKVLNNDQSKNIIDEGETDKISNIALINEENEIIKEWHLFNKTSMLIGKSTKEIDPDIDLVDSTYNALIDHQHAIMNFASDNWYIEDLYSKNGIRIQKNKDKTRYKLSKDRPCKICKGDIIFIAETKLLIR